MAFEADLLHQIGNAHAFQALFTKPFRGGDALMVFRFWRRMNGVISFRMLKISWKITCVIEV